MHYIVYKTTNLLNKKIYIGQHICHDINDGYLGSGVALNNAISKYGVENFAREVLYDFDSFEDMNQKEIELVNLEFILRKDTYNIQLGGTGWNTKNTVVVNDLLENNVKRIPYEIFNNDRERYVSLAKNKLVVWCNKTNNWTHIDSCDYDKTSHVTPSTNKMSVRDTMSGETKSIKKSEFNPVEQVSVFGGIVVNIDGIGQYVTREEYDKLGVKTHTYGKVTVLDITDGKTKHVSCEEFWGNRDKYKTSSNGKITGRHKITNEKVRFETSEITDAVRREYYFSTAGHVTVKCKKTMEFMNITRDEFLRNRDQYIAQTEGIVIAFDTSTNLNKNKYSNIPKELYNNEIHKLPKDIKCHILDAKGDKFLDYWGTKKRFLDCISLKIGVKLTRDEAKELFSGKKIENAKSQLNGSILIYEDWKKYYGLH